MNTDIDYSSSREAAGAAAKALEEAWRFIKQQSGLPYWPQVLLPEGKKTLQLALALYSRNAFVHLDEEWSRAALEDALCYWVTLHFFHEHAIDLDSVPHELKVPWTTRFTGSLNRADRTALLARYSGKQSLWLLSEEEAREWKKEALKEYQEFIGSEAIFEEAVAHFSSDRTAPQEFLNYLAGDVANDLSKYRSQNLKQHTGSSGCLAWIILLAPVSLIF